MTQPTHEDKARRLGAVIAVAFRAHWKLLLFQGGVMMALGLVAVAIPQIATLTIEIFIGWLLVIGGLFRTLMVLKTRSAPGFWWSLLAAIVGIVLGLLLLVQPFVGVLTLTAVLIAVFLIDGAAAIFVAIDTRRHLGNWGWILFSGLVDLVLAYLIWQGWPATADWAIGLLVGINMFMFGLSLAMIALAARIAGPD